MKLKPTKYPVVITSVKIGDYIRAKVTSASYAVSEDHFYTVSNYYFDDNLKTYVIDYLNDEGDIYEVFNVKAKFGKIFYAHTYTEEEISSFNEPTIQELFDNEPNIEIGQSSDDDFCITGLTLKQMVTLSILLNVKRDKSLDEYMQEIEGQSTRTCYWLSSNYAFANTKLAKLFDDEFCKAYRTSIMNTSEVYLIKEKLLNTILDHFKK